MDSDQALHQLLKQAMSAPPPELSSDLTSRVMRCVRPRRLSGLAWMVLSAYVVVAVGVASWLMRDTPLMSIAVALAIGTPVAASVGAYGRRVALAE